MACVVGGRRQRRTREIPRERARHCNLPVTSWLANTQMNAHKLGETGVRLLILAARYVQIKPGPVLCKCSVHEKYLYLLVV